MKNRNGELCKYCVQCDKPCPYGFFNDDICTLTEEQCRKSPNGWDTNFTPA